MDLVRTAATAANQVEASADLVLGSPLNLRVSHAVQSLLPARNIHFSAGDPIFYEFLLFSLARIYTCCCNTLNTAALLLPKKDTHNCLTCAGTTYAPN